MAKLKNPVIKKCFQCNKEILILTEGILRQKELLKHIYCSKRCRQKNKIKNTSIELKIQKHLRDIGIEYEAQYSLHKWVCDFYVPSLNLLIEADGDYWHANPKIYNKQNLNKMQKKNTARDNKKNKYILRRNYILLRFWEDDINNNFNHIINSINDIIEKVSYIL